MTTLSYPDVRPPLAGIQVDAIRLPGAVEACASCRLAMRAALEESWLMCRTFSLAMSRGIGSRRDRERADQGS